MKKSLGISAKNSLISLSMVVLSTISIGIFSLVMYRNEAIQHYGEKALAIADSVVSIIDSAQFEEITASKEVNDYYDLLQAQVSSVRTLTDSEYLYVMDAKYDDEAYYFIEGYLPDEEVETYLGSSDLAENFADEMYESIDKGERTTTGVYDSGVYGQMVSGFSPIKNASGKVIGVVGVDVNVDDVMTEIVSFGFRIGLIIIATLAVLGWIPVVYISKSIGKPLRELCAASDKISTGDLDVYIPEIKTTDEVGRLANSFVNMVESTRNEVQVLETVANGDLSASVQLRCENDSMGIAIRKMIESLNITFTEVNGVSLEVAENAKGVSESSLSLAQGATEQTAAVAALGNSIAKVAEKTLENAKMATDAAKLGDTIKHNAEKGTQQMGQMIEAVREINEASNSISKVMGVIDSIAFQTNILALNAAVEAARAGQHGKGFAVVAEEVRNLASKSADAAKDTGSLIANSMEKAALGAKIAEATSVSLADIVSGINENSRIVKIIAESSENQTNAINEINRGISQVGEVVQLISKGAELSSGASFAMQKESGALSSFISSYKLKEDNIPRLAQKFD